MRRCRRRCVVARLYTSGSCHLRIRRQHDCHRRLRSPSGRNLRAGLEYRLQERLDLGWHINRNIQYGERWQPGTGDREEDGVRILKDLYILVPLGNQNAFS